jgi:hypothetical protein
VCTSHVPIDIGEIIMSQLILYSDRSETLSRLRDIAISMGLRESDIKFVRESSIITDEDDSKLYLLSQSSMEKIWDNEEEDEAWKDL